MDDKLWIGTFNGVKIYNTSTKHITKIQNPGEKNELNEVRHIYVDNKKRVWVFYTSFGIRIFDGKTNRLINAIPNSKLAYVKKAQVRFLGSVEISPQKLLIATSIGLREISYDEHYNIMINKAPLLNLKSLNNENIYSISKNSVNQIVITSPSGLYRFDKNLLSFTQIKDQLAVNESDWLKAVFCTFSDKYNNLWLGCQEGVGLLKSDISPFKAYYFDNNTGLKLDHVLSIYTDNNNSSIFAGLRNGFMKIDRKSGLFKQTNSALSFQHIFRDPFKRLQISFPQGVFIYNQQNLSVNKNFYPEFKPFETYGVNSHLTIGDSVILMGTENDKGVLVWNYKKRIVGEINISTKPGLAANIVNTTYKGKDGTIWVLSDKVITLLKKNLSQSISLSLYNSKNKQPYNIFFDICEARNFYWIAAYGTGIIKLDSKYRIKKIYTTKDGLSNAGVYKIFPVGDSSLVITSNTGLSVLNLNSSMFQNYYQADGLHSDSFEEACGIMVDGKIYAGGVKGFTMIDPSKFRINQIAPTVYVNRIVIETSKGIKDTSNLKLQRLDVPNNVLQTSLYFSGLNYSNPARTTFAYRISEQNEKWTHIGTRNFINIIGLNPGNYTVQVKAANEDGIWSKPITLTLAYIPRWYQTIFFKALIIIILLAMGYSFYQLRINQILKEHRIRTDIASDLHDDIGSTLNSIKVFTHLAGLQHQPSEYLADIKTNLDHATAGLRDMIWVLDDQKDSIADLINRLRQQLLPLADAMGRNLVFLIHDDISEKSLNKTEKRNLYFIAKEAINNCLKYADSSKIFVEFSERQNKLSLNINDDGKGFNTKVSHEGYGLKNMRSRANQINYDINVDSQIGVGTRIQVRKK